MSKNSLTNYTKNGNGNLMNEVQCMVISTMVGVAYDYHVKLMNCQKK